MSASKPAFPFRLAPSSRVVYPRFGGRPVRASVGGHPGLVALALVAAIAATALSLPSLAGPADPGAVRSHLETPAAWGPVRTTGKADRLKPAPTQGCDGAWGNEPLECLLQTA